jgi:hypothetical protein
VRQLAFSIVDRGYLSGERGRVVIEAMLRRWSVHIPREVFAFVSRIMLLDAAALRTHELTGEKDSSLVLLLWNAALDVLASPLATPVPDGAVETGNDYDAENAEDAACAPASPSKRERERATSRPLKILSKPLMPIDHARVLVLLFVTLTEETRSALLTRTAQLLCDHAAACKDCPASPRILVLNLLAVLGQKCKY